MIFICYVCISTLLQTKDDFRFIIPYMEFSKEIKGARPLVLDTSVVIDGRIADVAETRVIDQPMVVPRFVLQELQSIADSSDKLRRNRGRRGLDILNRLQKSPGIEVRIHDAEIPELAGIREVDQRLVVLAKHLGGKVVTNDYNLNKIARLQGVEVINLNDLANAMKPIVLPGENLTVKMLKRGEEQGQGVGYLDDGTMVVAEQGAYHLGETRQIDRHQRPSDQCGPDDLRPHRPGPTTPVGHEYQPGDSSRRAGTSPEPQPAASCMTGAIPLDPEAAFDRNERRIPDPIPASGIIPIANRDRESFNRRPLEPMTLPQAIRPPRGRHRASCTSGRPGRHRIRGKPGGRRDEREPDNGPGSAECSRPGTCRRSGAFHNRRKRPSSASLRGRQSPGTCRDPR